MMHNKAFTLVELIVVITILAVLWTIAFVSFQWYAASSRDSVRITDLKNIDKVLKLKVTAWETLLLPEQALKITASWTTLSYQWNMSEKLLNHYGITNGWLDPLDNIPYTYSVNENRNKYQLLWFLETWDSVALNVAQTFADNSQRFPKTTWDTLWILLDETTNIPLVESWSTTELDIETTADTYWLIIQNSTSIQKWDKEFLTSELDFKIHTKWSCKNILLNGLSKWDGFYLIEPKWTEGFKVYCDMTTDGWGWTALFRMNASKHKIDFWYSNKNTLIWDEYNYLEKSDLFTYNEISVTNSKWYDGWEYVFEKIWNDLYAKRWTLKNAKIVDNRSGLSKRISEWISLSGTIYTYWANAFSYNGNTYNYLLHNNTSIYNYDFPFYTSSLSPLSDKPWWGRHYRQNEISTIFVRDTGKNKRLKHFNGARRYDQDLYAESCKDYKESNYYRAEWDWYYWIKSGTVSLTKVYCDMNNL